MKPVRGRPKREELLHRIYLCKSTFQQWNERKVELRFEKDTNNQFALFLLNLLVDPSKGAAETEEETLASGLHTRAGPNQRSSYSRTWQIKK